MPPSIAPVWYATSNLGHGSQPSSREPSDLGQAPAAQNLLAVVEDGPTTLSSQVSHSGHSSVEQAVEQTLSQDVDLTSETHGSTEDLDEELGGSSPLPQENAIEKKPSGIPARLGLGAPPRVRLTDDENTPPSGVKRVLESSDQLSPRKRSSSGNSSTIARVDSGSKSLAPRRASGKATPRSRLSSVSKAVLTPARQVSAMSTGSLHSLASAIDEVDIVMSDHADIHTAFDSTRLHIADARKLARRVRMDALAMRKLRAASASTAALPRSPQTRNIHSVLSAEEEEFLKVDTPDLDDLARHICLEGELLETQLASALADSERARMLARRAAEATGQYEATITTMEGQLGHAREREELLQEQLRRRDIELEEIYNVSALLTSADFRHSMSSLTGCTMMSTSRVQKRYRLPSGRTCKKQKRGATRPSSRTIVSSSNSRRRNSSANSGRSSSRPEDSFSSFARLYTRQRLVIICTSMRFCIDERVDEVCLSLITMDPHHSLLYRRPRQQLKSMRFRSMHSMHEQRCITPPSDTAYS